MKTIKLIGVLSLSAILFSCGSKNTTEEIINSDIVNNPASASNNTDPGMVAKFKFEKDVHDFGSIVQNEKVSYAFKFTNIGKSDLVISSAVGSCGCTVPNYPKTPIKPNENGVIDVTFDSHGKEGMQTKTVTIIGNTLPNSTVITIKGEVKVEGK